MKNNFLNKVKNFVKRNSYALVVSCSVLLVATLIGVGVFGYAGQKDNIALDNVETNNPDMPNEDIPTNSETIISFVMPIKGGEITKEYAENHLIEDKTTGFWQAHLAVDFKAEVGTKVLSVYDGIVEKVENSMMDGLTITIKHSGDLKSVYKCLGEDALVKEGENVSIGQEIATVATNLTEKADGAHLHFELYENGKLVDPTPYFVMEK